MKVIVIFNVPRSIENRQGAKIDKHDCTCIGRRRLLTVNNAFRQLFLEPRKTTPSFSPSGPIFLANRQQLLLPIRCNVWLHSPSNTLTCTRISKCYAIIDCLILNLINVTRIILLSEREYSYNYNIFSKIKDWRYLIKKILPHFSSFFFSR